MAWKKDDIFLAIQKASQAYDFAEVVPISALKREEYQGTNKDNYTLSIE